MTHHISVTASEAIDRGLWDQLCEMRGWNVWIVNEGRMPSDEVINLTEDEARKLGLLPRSDDSDG